MTTLDDTTEALWARPRREQPISSGEDYIASLRGRNLAVHYLGELVDEPVDPCVPAMRAAGFDPADVRYVLQSHLHLDHTGALAAAHEFPNSDVIATRTEYEYAFAPDWFAAGGYIQKDYNKPGVPWALLDETDDGYDVDGSLGGEGTARLPRLRCGLRPLSQEAASNRCAH